MASGTDALHRLRAPLASEGDIDREPEQGTGRFAAEE